MSVPSTTVQLGDRTIAVEATPLAKSRNTRLGTVTDQPRANRFHLKQPIPRWARWLLAFVLLIVTMPILITFVFVVTLFTDEHHTVTSTDLTILGIVGVPVIMSFTLLPLLFLFGRRPPLDFTKQHVRFKLLGTCPSWLGRTRIIAIQLISGRIDEDLRGPGPSLQLNLILDHAAHPRVGFITYRAAEWTRNAAQRLANYLQVPLIDQLPSLRAEEPES
jgi:hypothetical protein